jgi:hypothetical protein
MTPPHDSVKHALLRLQQHKTKERIMNRTRYVALAMVAGVAVAGSLISTQGSAQVAGSTVLGVA